MRPELTFVGVLLLTLAWGVLPFVPAFLELFRPKDATPLNAVGKDSGDLSFFATSFTKRATSEGLLGATPPAQMSDGTPVFAHGATQVLPPVREPLGAVIIAMDDTILPAGITASREVLGRLTLRGGADSMFRAVLGQRDIVLGPRTEIQRWIHAVGKLEVGQASHLRGRATADREVLLGPDVLFERLDAPVVRVGGSTMEPPILPLSAFTPYLPNNAVAYGTNYWYVKGDLEVPAGYSLAGTVICTGRVVLHPGSRVEGSIKAHETIHVHGQSVVVGSLVARALIVLEDGARVHGPIISETGIAIGAAVIGMASRRTTVTAPKIRLHSGATIYGAVIASEQGGTFA